MNYRGLSGERRKYLARILAAGKGVITIDSAMKILELDREKTRLLLSSLSRSGWLKPIKSGLFVPVPLEADEPDLTEENEFVLANYLYGNCYIGGWSAASFWGLTDQIFLKTWVMTSRAIRKKKETNAGHSYIIRHIPDAYFFGVHTEWIGQDKILISDLHKTVIDFVNFMSDFDLQGLVDVFREYMKSKHKNLDILIDYAAQSSNRTVYKRIGFLLELYYPQEVDYINVCLQNISKGPSKLAPNLLCDVYMRKWHLYIPKNMEKL